MLKRGRNFMFLKFYFKNGSCATVTAVVCCVFYFLFRLIIKNVILKKNIPNPNNKQIVLIGCPNFVVKANPSSRNPIIIDEIEIIILILFVNLSSF